jgi:hypothetical protein
LVTLAISVCLCIPLSATGQAKPVQSPPAAAAAAPKSPDIAKEGLVLEKVYTRVRMEADGTGTRESTTRVHVLADSGVKQMAVLTFTYTASNQQVEIGYVRVIKPDGSVVVTPDYNVQDMPADVTRQAPMYSDIHQKHVTVKGLGVGDILETQITYRTFKPEVPGQFWMEYSFEKNLIILDEQLDLDLPADKAVTVASADLQPTITTANGRKLYHWASSNLARPDPDAPPKSTKHWKPSVQVTTFASWEQVGEWYRSLLKEPLAVTPAIQAKATALTAGLTTDEDKLRAIFNDVALHIHYVGLDFGIGRYQPHPADDVLSNEYGDCKDKHTLLAAELKAAGIEAWPVLISSSRELDSAVPSPAQFDHVITLVPLGGKLLWMDSTEEVAPVGVLMSTLRDKQALAIPGDKPAYLERTAAELPFAQSTRFQSDGKLSDQGLFTGHIAQNYHGDAELLLRVLLRQVPQSQWKVAMQGYSNGLGFVGEVSNPQISEIEQTNKPLEFSYDYTREKYHQWSDHDTSHWIDPPLPGMGGELAPGVKEKKPADEPDLGARGETVYLSTMQLPADWSMTPPDKIDLKEDWLEYHAKYSFKNGNFTTERRLIVKKTKVPLDDWEKYLAFRRDMFEDWNHQVLIFPPGTQNLQNGDIRFSAPQIIQSQYTGVPTDEMKEQLLAAIQPMHEAEEILEADPSASPEDLAKAVALSRKAVDDIEATTLTLPEDDPHSLFWTQALSSAWCMLGWSSLEIKDLATAENYLRAAWRLSQDRTSGYQLGRLLEMKGDKSTAAHQYELAHVTNINNSFGGFLYSNYNLEGRIADGYKRVTGMQLTSVALNHGQYNGSLRAELDKQIEIRAFTRTSKITGEALFAVAYEAGKPVKVRFLDGDKKVESMASSLEKRPLGVLLPASSKARLLREVRLVCSQYGGGCDAYMLAPTEIKIPAGQSTQNITLPIAPNGTKTVRVELHP